MRNAKWKCSVAVTIDVIGGKWKPTILFYLKDRPRRFNELRRLIPDITQRMLTLQLRTLERDGIVRRTVYDGIPPKVEYSFTEKGWTLGPILDAMERWGAEQGGSLPPRAPLGSAAHQEPRR